MIPDCRFVCFLAIQNFILPFPFSLMKAVLTGQAKNFLPVVGLCNW